MEPPCWCPPDVHQHGGHKVTETKHLSLSTAIETITLELRNIEIITLPLEIQTLSVT